ncbi:MAG: GNAT family N-acetyltransferase [Parachlamydiaceae bacterium]
MSIPVGQIAKPAEGQPVVHGSNTESKISSVASSSMKEAASVAALPLHIGAGSPLKLEHVTDDLATHVFLETRIGSQVLAAAHGVINSLNKDIIGTAPLNEQHTEELEKAFLATLPSYGTVPNEQCVIERVLKEKIGVEHYQLREFTEGGSGAKVYGVFIPDTKGKLSYVIKTMEGNVSELARELSSLQQLSDLNLRESHCPTAQTSGQFQVEQTGKTHTIFIQTAAKGQPFTSLVEDAGKAQGEDRQKQLVALQKGLTHAARGLAELHLQNHDKAVPIGEETKAFNRRTLDEVYDLALHDIESGGEKCRIPLTSDELKRIHEIVVDGIKENWGNTGYSHGDSHLENLFFEVQADHFSFIDTPSFLASTNEEGHPIGFPPYDFAWTYGSISEKGFRAGLSSEEVKLLQETFKSEYQLSMGDALSSPPAQHFAALTKQCYFIWKANQGQEYLLDHKDTIPDFEERFARLQLFINHEVDSIVSATTLDMKQRSKAKELEIVPHNLSAPSSPSEPTVLLSRGADGSLSACIDSKSLRLQSLSEADRENFISVWSNEKIAATRGNGRPKEKSVAEEEFNSLIHDWNSGNPLGTFTVLNKETGEFIGFFELQYIGSDHEPLPGEAAISYLISDKHWGKGYATEALKSILAYAKTTAKERLLIDGSPLHTLHANAWVTNVASMKVLEKAGFHQTTPEDEPINVHGILKHFFSVSLSDSE